MNIVVAGAEGKTGSLTVALLRERGYNPVPVDKYGKKKETLKDFGDVRQADGIIDFSLPEGAESVIEFAKKRKIPLVSAVTGQSEETKNKFLEASEVIPIICSDNFSRGFGCFLEEATFLAEKLHGFDVEIIEYHGRTKKDAPSGSALKLFGKIKARRASELKVGRKGYSPKTENEIGISSVRTGDCTGRHEVLFGNGKERITLIHEVFSREVFALGAIEALLSLIGKPAGLYGTQKEEI